MHRLALLFLASTLPTVATPNSLDPVNTIIYVRVLDALHGADPPLNLASFELPESSALNLFSIAAFGLALWQMAKTPRMRP